MKILDQKEIKEVSGGNCLCRCYDRSEPTKPSVMGGYVNDGNECTTRCRSMGPRFDILYCQ